MFRIIQTVLATLLLAQRGARADIFDYEHQSRWYDEYGACVLQQQSPIELSAAEAVPSFDIPPISFRLYGAEGVAWAQNNGHSVNIVLGAQSESADASVEAEMEQRRPYLADGPLGQSHFVAESIHFHWGSQDTHGAEHVVNGERHSLEMHIVHRNRRYESVEEALGHADGLAVLGIFFGVNGEETQHGHFAGLEPLLERIDELKEPGSSFTIEHFSLASLLAGLDSHEFFTYNGSLTTPPCAEAVTWIVFPSVMPISAQQMHKFRTLHDEEGAPIENNYRALQARSGRIVRLRQEPRISDSVVEGAGFWQLLQQLHRAN